MKQLVVPLVVASLATGLTQSLTAQDAGGTPEVPRVLQVNELCSDHADAAIATFEDANLEAIVRAALGIGTQDALSCGLVTELMGTLGAASAGIVSLMGIQNLTSVTFFDLEANSITDISALSGLTRMTLLDLDENPRLSNIRPLLDNMALGARDRVRLRDTRVRCTDVAALEAKGVRVRSDCSPSP